MIIDDDIWSAIHSGQRTNWTSSEAKELTTIACDTVRDVFREDCRSQVLKEKAELLRERLAVTSRIDARLQILDEALEALHYRYEWEEKMAKVNGVQ